MVDATLSRGGTSIDIPLVERGGDLLLANDVGKPELTLRKGGELNPRFDDRYSGLQTLTLNGQYQSSTAYDDAISLANFIKSQPKGDDTELSVSALSEYPDPMLVSPAIGQESPLQITYEPGRMNWVEVQLSLSRINSQQSNSSLDASTPQSNGNGPIKLEDITLSTDITITRQIGRPNDSEQKTTSNDLPNYIYKRKPAYDAFEISFREMDNPVTNTQDIRDLVTQQLGRTPLTLDFQGTFGLGAFDVVPAGSRAFRHIRTSGKKGVVEYPQLRLRRVRS